MNKEFTKKITALGVVIFSFFVNAVIVKNPSNKKSPYGGNTAIGKQLRLLLFSYVGIIRIRFEGSEKECFLSQPTSVSSPVFREYHLVHI